MMSLRKNILGIPKVKSGAVGCHARVPSILCREPGQLNDVLPHQKFRREFRMRQSGRSKNNSESIFIDALKRVFPHEVESLTIQKY